MIAALNDASLLQLAAAVAGFFLVLSGFGTLVGFALERAFTQRRVWALPLDPGQLRLELIGNVVFLLITSASFTAVLANGATRFVEPSTTAAVVTFFALMLGFQVYYYGLHRLMHTRAFVRFHRWHHKSRVTTPLSGQSMSWVEALGWAFGYALLPCLFSYLVPISLEGWVAYMVINVFGNVVGHANVELVPASKWLRSSALLGNTFTFHALHHARWTGHYSFQAALMDRLFGSEWGDWLALHARVARGQALESLRATADTKDS